MSSVLSERSTNISPEKKKDGKDSKPAPKTLEFHRQMLESRLKEENNQQTYVSPSDTIQSPATQKLAAFRSKHLKAAKPRSLFAKTATKNAGDLASSQSTSSSQETTESDLS